jgi:polar amino acid transport system substrate-binding protein
MTPNRTTRRMAPRRTYPLAMRATRAISALAIALVATLAAAPAGSARPAPDGQASQSPAASTDAAAASTAAAGAPPQDSRATASGEPRTLKIGTTTLPPYSWAPASTKPFGPAVWLATEVASALGLATEWRTYGDLEAIYDALRRGEIDLAATGLPIIAPGDEPFLFSQPWDSSGFSVAMHLRPKHRIAGTLRHIFTGELLMWFSILLACMVGFGVTVSLMERRKNADHFGGIRGLGEGVWWSIVTMATVGYGDRVPKTALGRTVAGAWMLMALILITIIAGVLSSALTTSRLAGYLTIQRDVRSVRVGIVNHRADVDMARILGIAPEVYDSPNAAIEALSAHEIDALLYPTTALHALVRLSDDPSLAVMPQELARGFVAFGVSASMPSRLLKQINTEIVRATSTPAWVMQSRDLGDGENQ